MERKVWAGKNLKEAVFLKSDTSLEETGNFV